MASHTTDGNTTPATPSNHQQRSAHDGAIVLNLRGGQHHSVTSTTQGAPLRLAREHRIIAASPSGDGQTRYPPDGWFRRGTAISSRSGR
jgi:hypothetical protein